LIGPCRVLRSTGPALPLVPKARAKSTRVALAARGELACNGGQKRLESDIMATLTVDGNHLVVLLSALERAHCGET
jgi:hypothetical protein